MDDTKKELTKGAQPFGEGENAFWWGEQPLGFFSVRKERVALRSFSARMRLWSNDCQGRLLRLCSLGGRHMDPVPRQRAILLVEDNDGDVTFLQEAFLQYVNVPYRFHVVSTGEEALAFLQQQDLYEDAPRPSLILLDIRLPKRSGWEVLAVIRATPSLTTIPVVILAGVLDEGDAEQREALQPTLCLLKPRTPEQYEKLVESIETVMS
jgi:CheY-like chemotaxis protein